MAVLPPALFAAAIEAPRSRPSWQTLDLLVGRPDAELEARADAVRGRLAEPDLPFDELLGLRVELECIAELLADRRHARAAG